MIRPGGRLGWRRRLATAVDQGLEVGTGTELGHRLGGHVDLGTGCGVPRRTSGGIALLEDAEARDGALVAIGHCRLNGLKDRVQRLGRGLLVPQAT